MTSESTRFLGQPRDTNPTVGRPLAEAEAIFEPVFTVAVDGSTREGGTRSILREFEDVCREEGGPSRTLNHDR